MDYAKTSKILSNSLNFGAGRSNIFNYNPILDYFKDNSGFNKYFQPRKYSIGGGEGGGGGDIHIYLYIFLWILTLLLMMYIVAITIVEGITTSYYDLFISLLLLLIVEIILTVIIKKKLKFKLF